jgi:ribosomal protein S18 acetylase RimI-like enzyme
MSEPPLPAVVSGRPGGTGFVVRPAAVGDAEAIASVKVAAWKAAYRGIVPDPVLDGLDLDDEAATWRMRLRDQVVVRMSVAELDEPPAPRRPVGYVTEGPARGDDEAGLGEIWAIDVDPAVQGRGVGRALMDAAVGALAARGFAEAILWVFEANAPARGFYEHLGWVADGASKPYEIGGATPLQLRFRRRLG